MARAFLDHECVPPYVNGNVIMKYVFLKIFIKCKYSYPDDVSWIKKHETAHTSAHLSRNWFALGTRDDDTSVKM